MVRQLTKAMCLMTSVAAMALSAPPAAMAADGGTGAAVRPAVEIQREVERRDVELATDTAIALASGVPFSELSIANPEIADISTISNDSLYLLGKRPGRTTLMLMGEDGEVMSIIDVHVTPDISELRARLAEILAGEEIDAFTANDGIVLTGHVSSQAEIDRALALAGHYAPGRISNLMTVEAPVAALPAPAAPAPAPMAPDPETVRRHLAEILPLESIGVHVLGETLVLSGRASSPEAVQRAVEVARLASGGASVSNLLTVEALRDCTVRTRRGGEMIETTIPCGEQVSSARQASPVSLAGTAPSETAFGEQIAELRDPTRPRPRPLRLDVN
jgi:Flp pilus assembly secretin CpaC